MKFIKLGSSLLVWAFCVIAAFAQQNVTRHQVSKGETLYSLARKHGVTVDDLVAANPRLRGEALKAGMEISIPTVAVAPQGPAGLDCRVMHKVARKETAWSIAQKYGLTVDELIEANPEMKAGNYKLKKGTFLCIPPVKADKASQKALVEERADALPAVNVAVVLPLTSGGGAAERSLEFYRGFLMGVDKLKKAGKNINVYAYDEPAGASGLTPVIADMAGKNIHLVVGPLYPQNMAAVSAFSSSHPQAKWLQPFSSKVPQIGSNRDLFMVNAPDIYKTQFVAKLFTQVFQGAKVVFLRSNQTNEQSFVTQLQTALTAAGHKCVTLQAGYTSEQMRAELSEQKQTTVFVPDASTLENARLVLDKMKWMKKLSPDSPSAVLGFPEWLGYGGEIEESMYAADTYVFANYYYNVYDEATKTFEQEYRNWFKTPPLAVSPRMGLLGYDVCVYAVGGILKYGAEFASQKVDAPCLQSYLHFVRPVSAGGMVNDCMQFLHYRPAHVIDRIMSK